MMSIGSSSISSRLLERLDPLPVFLVGLTGCGKSSIGKVLQRRLPEYDLYDTDDIIRRELGTGESITSLFESKGERAFREMEGSILEAASSCHRAIIATGGGMVTHEANWKHLNTGPVVFLDTPVDVIARRLLQNPDREIESRPLLNHLGPSSSPHLKLEDRYTALKEKLQNLLKERRIYYERARVVVKLGDWTLDQCTEVVLHELAKHVGR